MMERQEKATNNCIKILVQGDRVVLYVLVSQEEELLNNKNYESLYYVVYFNK